MVAFGLRENLGVMESQEPEKRSCCERLTSMEGKVEKEHRVEVSFVEQSVACLYGLVTIFIERDIVSISCSLLCLFERFYISSCR